MSTKHRTKIVGMPTKIVTIPVAEVTQGVIDKIPFRWIKRKWNDSRRVYAVAYKDDNGRYHEFSFEPEELKKKTNKKKIKGQLRLGDGGCGFWVHKNIFIPIERLFFVYIQNKLDTSYSLDNILRDYQKYIGTNKVLDADYVISCGQDFSYDRPYGHLVLQPRLNRKHIELRKKWVDNPKITFYFSGNLKLFKDVQKLLIEKYNAAGNRKTKETKNGQLADDGYEQWKLLEEFSTYQAKHMNEPNVYDYLHIGNTVEFYEKGKPRIRVKDGSSDDRSLSDLYKRDKSLTVKSIEQAEEFLDSYMQYIKLVLPKQAEVW